MLAGNEASTVLGLCLVRLLADDFCANLDTSAHGLLAFDRKGFCRVLVPRVQEELAQEPELELNSTYSNMYVDWCDSSIFMSSPFIRKPSPALMRVKLSLFATFDISSPILITERTASELELVMY
jgi:hypothetical protein